MSTGHCPVARSVRCVWSAGGCVTGILRCGNFRISNVCEISRSVLRPLCEIQGGPGGRAQATPHPSDNPLPGRTSLRPGHRLGKRGRRLRKTGAGRWLHRHRHTPLGRGVLPPGVQPKASPPPAGPAEGNAATTVPFHSIAAVVCPHVDRVACLIAMRSAALGPGPRNAGNSHPPPFARLTAVNHLPPPLPSADAHPSALKSVLESANPRMDSECASGCTWSTARATAPSPGRPTPGVVKQDKSSGGSVDTTKTRSGPRRIRRSSGERPIGAAKGTQSDTEALCQPPPPLPQKNKSLRHDPPLRLSENDPHLPSPSVRFVGSAADNGPFVGAWVVWFCPGFRPASGFFDKLKLKI